MSQTINLFFSFRSPYCYLATAGALKVVEDFNVDMQFRVVLPRALRAADQFLGDEGFRRVRYILDTDWQRRARMLGEGDQWPIPDPIVQDLATLSTAAEEQPYIYRLCYLSVEANRRGRGVQFAHEVSHIIFGGTKDWDKGDHLEKAVARAGLNLAELDAAIANPESHIAEIERNQEDLYKSGHSGVPTFELNGEPFFGQDRIDSLRFQLENDGLKR